MMDYLRDNTHILYGILGLALGGLILMIFVILLTNRAVKKAQKKRPGPILPPSVANAPPPKGPLVTKMPPHYGRFSEYFTRKGHFKVGELSLTFLRAMQFLRTYVGGRNPLYQLPWYVMMGATGSGKSTLMRASGISLPVGEQDFGFHGKPDCSWWFLDKGVVLDIRGNFFLNHTNEKSNETGWKSLIALLARYRGKRPLDGMILSIPATEFVGKEALSLEQLKERAQAMAQKLYTAQQSLGLVLPIYIILTKTDHIPGFRSFCTSLPKENIGNMLGWSNPYTLSTAYTSSWINQAFGYVTQVIDQLRLEIFSEGKSDEHRDGVFVFSSQLNVLQEGILTYTNQLFKESAYVEGLSLRGIYFCGDGVNHSILERPSAADLREDEGENITGQRHIYFAKDIFEQKIFKESGLAQPMRQRAARANKNLHIAKITTAGLLTVGTFGVMHTYDKFKSQNDDILPMLSKINLVLSQLQHMKGTNSSQTVALFDTYAKQLIQMMHAISSGEFSSIFIPASWFSPVQEKLNHSLRISYHHIILRTIYIDLLLKGRELLYIRPGLENRSQTLAQLMNPMESAEFAFLRDYVVRMSEFARNVQLFNDLNTSNDISPLRDLVSYSFKSDLPQSFEKEFHHFRSILRDSPFPQIDLTPYQVLSQDTLLIAYKFFLEGVLSVSDPKSIIGRLNLFLWQYGSNQIESLPDIHHLRALATELDQAVPKLGSQGKIWMDGDYFDGGPEFVSVIGLMHDSDMLGSKGMVERIAAETGVAFNAFKAEMMRLLPILSEDAILNPMADIKGQAYPSLVLTNLNKSLGALFRESFMAPPANYQLVTVIPENKVVFWDAKFVDAAERMVKRFDEFKNRQVLTLPAIVRENAMLLAQGNMQANVLATLARAQAFADAPAGISQGTAAEEIMRTKISNIKDVAPKFVTLLGALNKDSAGASFVALRNLLAHLATYLLGQVEKAAMNNPPYAIKGNSFEWWDGEEGGIYTALNVKDQDDLHIYFTLQHDRIKNWALNYAKYLVDFLRSDVMKDGKFSRTLVDRWGRIIEQITLSDEKKPDNSIAVMENEIKKLNDVTFETCFTTIKLDDVKESSGDFFVAVERMVKREMLARCEVIARGDSIKNYESLASFFNDRLKNRYPFVSNARTSKGEAEPSDLREFFKMYQEYGNSPERILAQITELGYVGGDMLAFLKSMEKVKEFFKEFLESEEDNESPVINFSVDFRVNKQSEQHANYIVEWYFSLDQATTITQHEKDRAGQWTYGNPVEFGFRWPDGIKVAPTIDESQKYMNVEDNTAKFNFSGNWSIIWLIQTYGQPKPSLTEPSPYLLKFVIPLGPEKKAVAFTRLTLRGPIKGKAPGKVLNVPTFPSIAPPVPQKLKDVAEKPVITKGKSKHHKKKNKKEKDTDVSHQKDVKKKKDDAKDSKKKEKDNKDDTQGGGGDDA